VNLLLQHLVETQPTLTTLEKLQDHSSINQMSSLYTYKPVLLVPFVTEICFPHLYLYLVYLCHHLKVAFGHTCEISFVAILCIHVLHS